MYHDVMSKSRKTNNNRSTQGQTMARLAHEAYVADMREGRVRKAQTFANKKRVANKRACRGKVQW